ncbi:MAG TPA: cytochrome c biogenesis protein CcsA [Gemmatimonadales bacterium]|jgi:heme exporter protein C|nr:cytochrome c biogenesis protein CcsA [Gemmatimonadales bacterium]
MTAGIRGRGAIRGGLAVTAIALLLLAGVYVMALKYTPVEIRQGLAQKIFYLHAPAAWSALLAFGLVGLISVLYLWLQDPRLDLFAASSVEVGLAFCLVMLTTGPIWAKPIWGTWWTWDPRLTLTLLLFFIFLGYLALRSALNDRSERARFSAVIGIMGLLLVPFIHISVYLFRTMHPMPILMKPSKPSLPPEMLKTLLFSFGVATLLYIGFVMVRYGLAIRQYDREEAQDES